MFNVLASNVSGNGKRRTWLEDQLGDKNLEKIIYWHAGWQNKISTTVPEYFKNMTCSLMSQERIDSFVNSLYNLITGWDEVTMGATLTSGERNQFYGLKITAYSSKYPNDYRPSGIYQAPDGFIKGISNGNPQTPLEKLYVLSENYKQRWLIAPEGQNVSLMNNISNELISDDTMLILP